MVLRHGSYVLSGVYAGIILFQASFLHVAGDVQTVLLLNPAKACCCFAGLSAQLLGPFLRKQYILPLRGKL